MHEIVYAMQSAYTSNLLGIIRDVVTAPCRHGRVFSSEDSDTGDSKIEACQPRLVSSGKGSSGLFVLPRDTLKQIDGTLLLSGTVVRASRPPVTNPAVGSFHGARPVSEGCLTRLPVMVRGLLSLAS